jgi:mono/diheme cytochrome c family protein
MFARRLAVRCVVAVAVVLFVASTARAQTTGIAANALFEQYCSTCHGKSGTGDGPIAAQLTKRPADLTRIALRNGGTFPSEQVERIVDGRNPVKGHGGGDMPVWGDAFTKANDTSDIGDKIRRLVKYVESLQVQQ